MQLRFGGVKEVTTNPTGGAAIFQATATPVPFNPPRVPPDGFLVYGTPRVVSDVMITPTPGYAPALGLMITESGYSSILYLYVLDNGTMMTLGFGGESQWLAQDAGNAQANFAPSGAQGRYLKGRTILVDTPLQRAASLKPPNCVVINSSGPTAAIGFVDANWNGMAWYYSGGSLKADTIPGWCSISSGGGAGPNGGLESAHYTLMAANGSLSDMAPGELRNMGTVDRWAISVVDNAGKDHTAEFLTLDAGTKITLTGQTSGAVSTYTLTGPFTFDYLINAPVPLMWANGGTWTGPHIGTVMGPPQPPWINGENVQVSLVAVTNPNKLMLTSISPNPWAVGDSGLSTALTLTGTFPVSPPPPNDWGTNSQQVLINGIAWNGWFDSVWEATQTTMRLDPRGFGIPTRGNITVYPEPGSTHTVMLSVGLWRMDWSDYVIVSNAIPFTMNF